MRFIAYFSFIVSSAFALDFQTVPDGQVVHVGEHAVFHVQASGKPPINYSWYVNNTLDSSSATNSFTTAALTLADNKSEVFCMISDESGQTQSSIPIRIQVLPYASQTVSLEGELKLSNGLADFETDLQVALFDKPANGSQVYLEEFVKTGRGTVLVRDGRFQVRLGMQDNGVTLLDVVKANQNLYVEFRAGADGTFETLAPRLPLTSFPFALVKNTVQVVGP